MGFQGWDPRASDPVSDPADPPVKAQGKILDSAWNHFTQMRFNGAFAFSWRNLGPKYPDYETQVQDEVYLSDMYFGFEGPLVDSVPFNIQFNMPTSQQGKLNLYQLNFDYERSKHVRFQIGKFLVPFGRYNELYRPDSYLTATRPLLFSSPDSLDLVVRVDSPRPPLSVGYTDLGGRVSYYPDVRASAVPEELTGYVINGLGEYPTNRLRTFPNPADLGIPPVPGNGTNIDFGHLDNNLADNNNPKTFGARAVWALGNVNFPWPVPEGLLDMKGVSLSASGMDGQYNLEGSLNYQLYDSSLAFDWRGFNITSEYVYGINQFMAPIDCGPTTACSSWATSTTSNPAPQGTDFEINQGYYVQAAWPLLRNPHYGKRLWGVLAFNQLFRRGPALDLFGAETIDGTSYSSLQALDPAGTRVSTRMDKYTAAVNYQMTTHFQLKAEYSYWVMGKASTPEVSPAPNHGLTDIYQTIFSVVMGF